MHPIVADWKKDYKRKFCKFCLFSGVKGKNADFHNRRFCVEEKLVQIFTVPGAGFLPE